MDEGMQKLFTKIYNKNRWNSAESRSGPSSTLRRTENLRKELPRLLHKFDIKTLFDAPCGDMNWMRVLLKEVDVHYIGGDIVEPLIEQHQADPELNKRGRFMLLDLTRDPLPAADMMLARDFLFHLSFADALAFMRNFAASDIRYLLTTSHINNGKFQNGDNETPRWRWIDLFQPPYSFPEDVLDKILDAGGDRYLYLWTRAQVADAYDRFSNSAELSNRVSSHSES